MPSWKKYSNLPFSAEIKFIALMAFDIIKKTHIAALVCFALALLLYGFGSTQSGAGGFGFLGFIFELMAWKKVSDSVHTKK